MAASAGTVTLNLDANSVKMIRELQKAQRKTKTTATRMRKDMAGAFTKIGKAASVMGVALGAAFTRSVIRNTIAQQEAVAQLNASLKSTGRFTESASQALRAHAAALQQTSTFGDEAIISAQSLLLTFKQLGGEVLTRTTQAVVDLSAKMGTDLKSSAIQLGKALNDPATGLSMLTRVGITFSDSQKKVIKELQASGKLAEAQGVILEELESQFGGAANAARNTLGGALKAVQNNFGDLLEVSGDDSKGLVGSLNELADVLADPATQDGFQSLAVGAAEFLATIAKLPAVVGFLKDELKELFGVVDEGDFVRRDEEIQDLEEQLESARKAANAWYRTENNIYQKRAESLEKEIALKKQLLEQDRTASTLLVPVEVTASRRPEGGEAPAPVVPAVLPDPVVVQEEADQVAAIIKGMVDEVREFGLSEDNRALLEIIDMGATDEQIAQLHAVQDELRLLNDIKNEEEVIAANRNEMEREYAALIAGTRTALEIHNEELARIEEMYRAGVIPTAQEYYDLVDRTNQRFEESQASTGDSANAAMGQVERAGVSAFNAWIDGSERAKTAFSDMAKQMLKEMAALIIKQAVLAAFGQGGGANGGFSFGAIFSGAKADGGYISGGSAYLVGERGPELVVPKTSGMVIPNDKIAVGGGGNITTVVNLPPSVQRQTAQQVATEALRIQKRATSRNQ